MRRACLVLLPLLACGASASADEVAAPPSTSPASMQPRAHGRLPKTCRSTSATRATARQPASADILGPASATTKPVATPSKVEGAWSIDPSWNASSGPTAAAYGTRGLLDELKHTPGESSGYGGGAALNLHF